MADAADGEEEQPSLLRNLSRALMSPIGMPMPTASVGQEASAPDTEPLQRQNSAQLNRDRVEENQRRLAQELLWYSLPVMGCMLVFVLALLIAGLVIYVRGVVVLFSSADKPCDQPIKWWLLVTLLVPWLQFHCNHRAETRPKRLQALVMPAVICAGISMCSHCKTCAETNPDLFNYATMYLIYHSIVWVTMMFITFGLVSVVFWMHRHGLLDSGPGAMRAARPGMINELPTVPLADALASCRESGDVEQPECSICQEAFDDSQPIKRTPCAHFFHEACLGGWLENGKTCPLCRLDLQEALGPPPGQAEEP